MDILIPIIVTILGVIYFFTIDRITDIIPIIGWFDNLIVPSIVAIVWLAYFLEVAIVNILNNWITLSIFVLLGVYIYKNYHKKKH